MAPPSSELALRGAQAAPAGGSLPTRPLQDLPDWHCSLDGKLFSFVPLKHRADVSLPPMRPLARARSEGAVGGRRGARRAPRSASGAKSRAAPDMVESRRCHGDFCDAEVRYPSSLQDTESTGDAWMREAKKLCNRELVGRDGKRYPLFTSEELVACARITKEGQPSPSAASTAKAPSFPPVRCGAPGTLCFSRILEARRHPHFCRWLGEEAGWMLDPRDADGLSEAARQIQEDDAVGGGPIEALTDGCTAGLRYRLREVPVCGNCLCIYGAIHSAIGMIRRQGRGRWSDREKRRRHERQLRQREREKEELFEFMVERQRLLAEEAEAQQDWLHASPDKAMAMPRAKSTSLFLEPEQRAWLHRACPSPSLFAGSSPCRSKSPGRAAMTPLGRPGSGGTAASPTRGLTAIFGSPGPRPLS